MSKDLSKQIFQKYWLWATLSPHYCCQWRFHKFLRVYTQGLAYFCMYQIRISDLLLLNNQWKCIILFCFWGLTQCLLFTIWGINRFILFFYSTLLTNPVDFTYFMYLLYFYKQHFMISVKDIQLCITHIHSVCQQMNDWRPLECFFTIDCYILLNSLLRYSYCLQPFMFYSVLSQCCLLFFPPSFSLLALFHSACATLCLLGSSSPSPGIRR